MDNQHRKISGYRELTQDEIDLMNRIKEKEAEVLALCKEITERLLEQTGKGNSEEWHRADRAEAHRWAAIGRTDIETGFMALVRSIAQPQPR